MHAPIAILVLLLLLGGCTVKEAVEPLKPSDFITRPELLREPTSTPFSLAWMAAGIESRQYDTLVVRAVRTDLVSEKNWIYSAGALLPTRRIYDERITDLADYLQKEISDAFENYHRAGIELTVDTTAPIELRPEAPPGLESNLLRDDPLKELLLPESKTLIVEVSIADANFGDPLIYGGLLAVPMPGVANLSTAVKSPSLTIEARLIDEESDMIITELIDRRFPQLKIVDLNRLTVSSALRELSTSFAEDLVASFYRKKGTKVGRRMPFSLIPW